MPNSNQLREDINNYWGQIYEMLGKNPNKPLNDDDFLKQHWIMYFTHTIARRIIRHQEFLLNEKFALQKPFTI